VLRQEVRSAREVVSPNVCRVYQLEELGERELVSMEYVDGDTLADVLRERSPLELDEAREIAAQLLAGLEAIHTAGLVHRDIKPENVMLTRAGRVVVMDFGVAKALAADPTKTVSGTPAYMSPEQARGGAIDARADLYSVGIVLAEMVAPCGARTQEAREAIWEGARAVPPELDDTPWQSVLARAVAPDPKDRHETAASLARALEEVTQRAGDAEAQPYPGLSSFTAESADYFFGRELEVEQMWRKLRRAHLLGLIGPSGAGKSSFLRAGLLPATPEGWRTAIAQPGDRPLANLGQALARQLAGDRDAVASLLRFDEPDVAIDLFTRWRRGGAEALLVLDQFEEPGIARSCSRPSASPAAMIAKPHGACSRRSSTPACSRRTRCRPKRETRETREPAKPRPASASRSSTSRCCAPGRAWCGGRRRTPTARSSSTSSANPPSSGKSAGGRRTCCGRGRRTASSRSGESASRAG
jgi:hypothetical protein